jgi:succinoglycan biosynthesis protein ExoA
VPNPRVTILLPVLNETAFIDVCLASLTAQDYPGELEIIVADGGSVDDTRTRVETWRGELPRLAVIENPDRIQSHGLNRAAVAASGSILIRADAHTTYAPDYVRASVETLLDTGATAVGGVQTAQGNGGFQNAVATAMSIPLAVGPAPFRHTDQRVEADTVYLGAFRKTDWQRLGGWRTLPSRVAEDADLYFRWREQGARIVVEPGIKSTYAPRDTVGGLWRQYYRYGLGKADMLYINGRWPTWRPAAPLGLLLALLAAIVAGLAWSWWPLAGLVALWQTGLALATRGRIMVMGAASVMHLAYGAGLLRGLLRRPRTVRRAVV